MAENTGTEQPVDIADRRRAILAGIAAKRSKMPVTDANGYPIQPSKNGKVPKQSRDVLAVVGSGFRDTRKTPKPGNSVRDGAVLTERLQGVADSWIAGNS